MKKQIFLIVGLLILWAPPAFSGSPYSGKMQNDERGSTNPGAQFHMMIYEQAEKNAEEQYAIITESPEDKKNIQDKEVGKNPGEGEKTQPRE